MKILGIVIFLVFCTISLAHASWTVDYYVDDFGDSTGEGHISGEFAGFFSNDFTTDSELAAVLTVNKFGVRIKLYEYYQRNLAKEVSPMGYTVLIKDENGDIIQFSTINFTGSIDIIDDLGRIHKLLMNSAVLKFAVKVDSRPNAKYRFKVYTLNEVDIQNSYRSVYKQFLIQCPCK